MYTRDKEIYIPQSQALLDQYRRSPTRPLRCHIGKLLQLFSTHLAEVSEEDDERELDALLAHHEETLDEQPFQDLGPDAFEESHCAFVFDDVLHDFGEGFERLAVPGWRGLRLETDFCDDEGLGCECGQRFGEGSEDCCRLAIGSDALRLVTLTERLHGF
jgi:hypothetical protein